MNGVALLAATRPKCAHVHQLGDANVRAQDAVRARGWDRFVAAALGAPEGGGDKVDNLAEIARRAGCTAAEVAHVGDGANDGRGAKRLAASFRSAATAT